MTKNKKVTFRAYDTLNKIDINERHVFINWIWEIAFSWIDFKRHPWINSNTDVAISFELV